MNSNLELFNRWFKTAKDDIEAAEWLIKGRFYNDACFMLQQSVEKTLKAFLYLKGERAIFGHSTSLLTNRCKNYDSGFEQFEENLKKLDRFYIPTRYPNGIPEGTPRENYSESDSNFAKEVCDSVIKFVENISKQ